MQKQKRIIALLAFAGALGFLIWWAASGLHIFTTTEHLVMVKDELFGTMTQKWVQGFEPGLDMLGPIAGVLAVVGGVFLVLSNRKTPLKFCEPSKTNAEAKRISEDAVPT